MFLLGLVLLLCVTTADFVCVCDFYLPAQNRSTQWTLPFVHSAENCTLDNCDEFYEPRLNAPAIGSYLVAQAQIQDLDRTWYPDTVKCLPGCPCIDVPVTFSNNCTTDWQGRQLRSISYGDSDTGLFYYVIPYEVLDGGLLLGFNWTLVLYVDEKLVFLEDPYHVCSETFLPQPAPPPPSNDDDTMSVLVIVLPSVFGGLLLFVCFLRCCFKEDRTKRRETNLRTPLLQ
jgi:hypothetical protein